jgi:hypothetical protein
MYLTYLVVLRTRPPPDREIISMDFDIVELDYSLQKES